MNHIAPIDTTFDYGQVTDDFAGTLVATADRIKAKVKRSILDYIEIGRELLTVKSELEHGLFLKWVEAEFRWTPRTAQNYIAAAEWAGDRYETVSHLPPTLVYSLASPTTPDDIKAEVRADLEAGKPVDVKAVKGKFRDARWQRQQAADQEQKHGRRKPVSETTPKRREREEEQHREEAERRETEQKAHAAEIVAILRKLPEQDFERLLELLTTASLWVVQGMLNRGRA